MQRSLELYYFLRLNHLTALIIAVHLDWTLALLSPYFPLNGKETIKKAHTWIQQSCCRGSASGRSLHSWCWWWWQDSPFVWSIFPWFQKLCTGFFHYGPEKTITSQLYVAIFLCSDVHTWCNHCLKQQDFFFFVFTFSMKLHRSFASTFPPLCALR